MEEINKNFFKVKDILSNKLLRNVSKDNIQKILSEELNCGVDEIYFNFAKLCVLSLKEYKKEEDDDEIDIHDNLTIILSMICILNWGLYPHLPKSIRPKFVEEKHWKLGDAPPRVFLPDEEFLLFLEEFFYIEHFASYHLMFLPHALSVFNYVKKDVVDKLIKDLPTADVFSAVIALLPLKINLAYVITDMVISRNDIFPAIESTSFPPQICAKPLSSPPQNMDPDDYYKLIFRKIFEAIRSEQGGFLAQCVLTQILKKAPEQFLKNFDLSPIFEWPNSEPIGSILYQINMVIVPELIYKVLVPPIPFRILFVSTFLSEDSEVYKTSISIIKNVVREKDECIRFIKILVSDVTLSALDLDKYKIVEENGLIYARENETDEYDQVERLEMMRNAVLPFIDVKYLLSIVDELPGTYGAIQFLASFLPKIENIEEKVCISILSFLSKIQGDDLNDIILKIAKTVFYNSKNIKSLPASVVEYFVYDIPEMININKIDDKIGSKDESLSDMSGIIKDLASPIHAIRGKGLFELRRGVMDKNSPLRKEENIKKIFPTVENQLKSPESYVYLNAIRTLESIGDVYPHLVVEKLCNEFPNKKEEFSLTIGQVLMLLVRRNGPGIVHSPDGNLCGHFIRAFARGVSSDSNLIQISSLSNLSTFVETLEFGCSDWLTDIVATIDSAWQQHHVLGVRRAASYLCYKTILTLGHGFQECSPEDLKRMANIVKRGRSSELDEVAHQNAEDCFQTMWECAASFL